MKRVGVSSPRHQCIWCWGGGNFFWHELWVVASSTITVVCQVSCVRNTRAPHSEERSHMDGRGPTVAAHPLPRCSSRASLARFFQSSALFIVGVDLWFLKIVQRSRAAPSQCMLGCLPHCCLVCNAIFYYIFFGSSCFTLSPSQPVSKSSSPAARSCLANAPPNHILHILSKFIIIEVMIQFVLKL